MQGEPPTPELFTPHHLTALFSVLESFENSSGKNPMVSYLRTLFGDLTGSRQAREELVQIMNLIILPYLRRIGAQPAQSVVH
jgi:hypothetical protein